MLYTNKASLKLSLIEKQMHFELGRILHQEKLEKKKTARRQFAHGKKFTVYAKNFFVYFCNFPFITGL